MKRVHSAIFWWKGRQFVASSKPGHPWTLARVQQVMRKDPVRAWWFTGFRREAIRALLVAPHSRKALPAAR